MKNTETINRSFCEKEEKIYGSRRFKKICIGPLTAFVMIFSCISLWGVQCFINDKGEWEEKNEWDGAGDTWTCKKCGTKNYNWQISCGGCRG